MKPVSWLSLLLISILVLAGCAPVSPMIQPTQGVYLPSQTNLPVTGTISPTSSLTPTVIETLSPTATQTLITTLEPESVKETMQPLLQNPMNCAIPCFLGITPGKTHLDEVRNFFSPLGLKHKEGTDPNSGMYVYSVGFESNIGRDSSAIFFTSNSLVKNIIVSPEITKQKEGSPREWIAYSPETLIKKYGKPSRVFFLIFRGPNLSNEITMILYFDDDNLIARYVGENMVPDQPHSPLLCPLTAPFDYVDLWMGPNPPEAPVTDSSDPTMKMLPLEQVTSLTIEQFIQLMLGDPKQACFTINGDMFPN